MGNEPETTEMPVKRRSVLQAALLGGGAALAAPAISRGLKEWRMVTSWPKGLPGLGTGAERLAANITRMSGGRLTIKTYAAGELVPALECFGAVANGTAQMGHDAAYYHTGKTEGAAFFTAFPFGFTAAEMDAWMKFGNGQKLWDELYAPFGLRGFHAGSTGTQMFGWFRRPIRSLADLQGLKFRAPGNQGRVLQKLGVTPVSLPGGEIFPALQSGAIDGAEWIGPYNDLALGFYQVCRYYYSPGYHEPGADAAADHQRAGLAHARRRTAGDRPGRGRGRHPRRDGGIQRPLRTGAAHADREAWRDRAAVAGGRAARLRAEVERGAERDPCRGFVARIASSAASSRTSSRSGRRSSRGHASASRPFLNARRLPFEFKLRG